jgi:hypothetical protein
VIAMAKRKSKLPKKPKHTIDKLIEGAKRKAAKRGKGK